jgi:hypothetical protein
MSLVAPPGSERRKAHIAAMKLGKQDAANVSPMNKEKVNHAVGLDQDKKEEGLFYIAAYTGQREKQGFGGRKTRKLKRKSRKTKKHSRR